MITPSGGIRPPSPALVAEQAAIQSGNNQDRSLNEYTARFGLRGDFTPVGEFLAEIAGVKKPDFVDVLHGLHEAHGDVHWVDMGGSFGVAQRQAGAMKRTAGWLTTTNVELVERDATTLTPAIRAVVKPRDLAPEHAPNLVLADSETVKLPDAPTVITSVEHFNYQNNQLGALANWYNQLAAGGLVLINRQGPWSQNIRYHAGKDKLGGYPVHDLLDLLKAKDVPHQADTEADMIGGERIERIKTLVVQKLPESKIQIAARFTGANRVSTNYKAPTYAKPKRGEPMVVTAPLDA